MLVVPLHRERYPGQPPNAVEVMWNEARQAAFRSVRESSELVVSSQQFERRYSDAFHSCLR